MFYSLTGTCIIRGQGYAVIDCGGVGFKCLTTLTTLGTLVEDKTETLYTHLNVREDALELFGFSTETELDYFKILLGVSGVGPKMALAVLSELTPDRFARAVAAGDYKILTKVSGVGTKTAQRIIIDLKDKLSSPVAQKNGDIGFEHSDIDVAQSEAATEALMALGFNKNEAARAVAKCTGCSSVEEILQKALKLMSRQ